VTGDYLYNCQDGAFNYDTYDAKNCSYMKDTEGPNSDSWDCNNYYYKCEFNYNIMGALQVSKCKNSAFVFYSNAVEYCDMCYNLSNAIGCISIRKGNYMILNKVYEKEEYFKLKEKIEEQFKKEKIFGQFFSPNVAPFAYNESLVHDFFPLTKEEALNRGYKWQNKTTGTYDKETIQKGDIPNSIENTNENILEEILVCENCNKNFKIIEAELTFYKKMGLPIPHKDFECRHEDRMKKRNGMQLWHRKCMKDGCENEFETTYSPDRLDIIYCESCYQKEVY